MYRSSDKSSNHLVEKIDQLRKLISYDAESGELRWLVSAGRVKKGDIAGSMNKGYLSVQVGGRRIQAHRIAWAIHYGVWPEQQIDHIDTDRKNNGIKNLREVTNSENHQNRRIAKNGSFSGVLGVYKYRNKWRSQIRANGKAHHLGTFADKDAAYAAYVEAKRKLHPMGTL